MGGWGGGGRVMKQIFDFQRDGNHDSYIRAMLRKGIMVKLKTSKKNHELLLTDQNYVIGRNCHKYHFCLSQQSRACHDTTFVMTKLCL